MTDRKKPVKHSVKSHTKNNKTVRSYSRGSGQSKSTPQILNSATKPKSRWEEENSGREYSWRSKENPNITVNVNLEEMENDYDRDDEDGEYRVEENQVYLVYPAYNNSGIPDSPEQFSEGSSGSISDAKKEAINMAKKIMKLPIEKIERFDWNMV